MSALGSARASLGRGEHGEPVPVAGLFETHLTVSDLGRSVAFYREVVGLQLAFEVPDRGAAFFWIGEPGEAMLGLWSLGSSPVGLCLHIAFKTSLNDVLGAGDRLRSLGVTPLSFFATEPTSQASSAGCPPPPSTSAIPTDTCSNTWQCSTTAPTDRGIVAWSEWARLRFRSGRGHGSFFRLPQLAAQERPAQESSHVSLARSPANASGMPTMARGVGSRSSRWRARAWPGRARSGSARGRR